MIAQSGTATYIIVTSLSWSLDNPTEGATYANAASINPIIAYTTRTQCRGS